MPTNQDTLGEVLGLERQIGDRLDAERQQAAEWLERARRDIEQETQAAIATLEAATRAGDVTGKAAAQLRADAILAEATAAVERIRGVPDEELVALVRQHLSAILPGTAA